MGTLPQLSVVKGPTRQLTPTSLHKLFQNHCQGELSSKIALIYEDGHETKKLTYGQVDEVTDKMAKILVDTIKEKNLQANSDGDYVIAVNMHPSDQLILVLLAIWKAGGAYLPLDHSFPQSRIEHILQEAQPVMVIYDEDTKDYSETLHVSYEQVMELCNSQTVATLTEGERVHHQKDDLAIILYTSGSTGIPKGVRIPHRVILNRLQWQFKTFPYSSTEKVCVFKTALTFVDSVSEIWGPLINGLTVLVVPKHITKDPERLINLLDKYRIERLVLVPSLLRSILMYLELKKNPAILNNLKLWVCSGEILTVSLAEEFFEHFEKNFKLCNFYGSTEIMGDVTFQILQAKHELKNLSSIPIGIPVDNTIIYLLDSDLRPVQAGDVGELFVSGLNLASGYVNGRDKDKFLNNQLAIDPIFGKLYRTGDFARIAIDGVLLYEGRTDSQVKIRGHRVDLSEVEKAVSDVKGVEKAVVLCYKPGEMNQALLAFVKSTALMNENQIENILKNKLTSYMVPQVVLVESIPLLVNGKIDRQALLKSYENTNNNEGDTSYEIDIDYAGVASDKMEAAKVLFETVASVLNKSARSAISSEANFYEIGGNSLNSIYTISQLNQQGYHINIGDFLSALDLGEILERITSPTCIDTNVPIYTSEPLSHEHKEITIDMITTSFYEKADLEQWIMPDVSVEDYSELTEAMWEALIEKDLSFIVKTDTGKVVAVSFNFDARDEPEVEIKSKLNVIFDFLEVIEAPVRDERLPAGKGKVFHSLMMATHSSLSAKENVAVMQFMESEVLNLATKKQFLGVFTTNSSPLTQQLASDVYHYQTMTDYQVNKYVARDNSRPFGRAPDSQRAIVQWKPIN